MSDKELAFTVVYDGEAGEVHVRGTGLSQAIEVRKGMVDEAVRHAAIVELWKLGYTVLEPDADRLERLARYMFEKTAEWRWLASSEYEDFDNYVERNQDEWREAAALLLETLR